MTPALHQLIEEKFEGLAKFLKRWEENSEVLLRIEIAKSTKHHQKGNVFYAEANLDLPGKVLRVEETNFSLEAAVNKLKERLKNELLRLKEKTVGH